jgi:two-component system, LytTR family, sensor kinase
VRDIELQSTILTAKDIHEIPRGGSFGPSMQPSVLRHQEVRTRRHPRTVILLSLLALATWAVGVFFYSVNDFILLKPETWWFNTPTPNSLINSTINTVQEQWVAALGLLIFGFTPLFRRAIQDKLLIGDQTRLLLVFALLQGLLVAQYYYFYNLQDHVHSYGFFLVIAAGLLGGWRVGLLMGVLNMLSLGALFNFYRATDSSFIRVCLTELHLVVPIWVGAVTGYLRDAFPKQRFSWIVVLLCGLVAEWAAMTFTVISNWSPSDYVDRFFYNVFTTPILLLGFSFLVYYRREYDEGTLKMTQTELALAEAELKALRAQINPHFMLNSLSVIHHLVRTQPETARALLLDLSDLFQHTLRAGDFVPLRQELEHVRAYLALEQARLTKRLSVMWAVLAEDKLETPVPTLILQPIIENAIVHGIAPKPEGGTVSILVKQSGDDLHVQVVDNGIGFDTKTLNETSLKGERERPSIGFQNIDLRLRLLYGEAYRLQIASTPGAGTTVELKIPVTLAPALSSTRDRELVKV